MNTYSVRQISEILGTNPETVRRWIRDDKLKAVQISRKNGNVVTESELERFIKATPKYSTKLTTGLGLASILGMGVLTGGIMVSALLGRYYKQKGVDARVRPEDLKAHLQGRIEKLHEMKIQKQELIHQTEAEIEEISTQIEQYTNLLEDEALIVDVAKQVKMDTEG